MDMYIRDANDDDDDICLLDASPYTEHLTTSNTLLPLKSESGPSDQQSQILINFPAKTIWHL